MLLKNKMEIFVPLIIGASFIIFLFCLFVLSKDDFLFLKKNITIDQVFNTAFIAGLVGLFFARIFYVVFNFAPGFLNPFVFLLFPYFPGLSILGAIIGIGLTVFAFSRGGKIPVFHVFDFFSIAFLSAASFGFVLSGMRAVVEKDPQLALKLILPLAYITTFIFFVRFFLHWRRIGELKEGSISLLFFVFFSFFQFTYNFAKATSDVAKVTLEVENYLLIPIFLISLILFIKNEGFIDQLRSGGK